MITPMTDGIVVIRRWPIMRSIASFLHPNARSFGRSEAEAGIHRRKSRLTMDSGSAPLRGLPGMPVRFLGQNRSPLGEVAEIWLAAGLELVAADRLLQRHVMGWLVDRHHRHLVFHQLDE